MFFERNLSLVTGGTGFVGTHIAKAILAQGGRVRLSVHRRAPLLVGPAVAAVSDDPEGRAVLEQVSARWSALPADLRRRVHLVTLPMDDAEENGAMVNAVQRRADVVVQKSLAEGFGLTVAEAMWKSRPVVVSGVGGIQDQVLDEVTGLVVPASDLKAFGYAVSRLLNDAALAERLGTAARERVRREFLEPRHLRQWVDLVDALPLEPVAQDSTRPLSSA